ncbi:MAG: ribosome maturation factor RimP [Candidatus Aminicenantes bacterium]|nr:ribosome maturation factor RimP [Candidatus Aminicenantes bacterium]MDH5714801.1 ribosome maturation factor RimP [Candidatus Aminicenantes bacterium]
MERIETIRKKVEEIAESVASSEGLELVLVEYKQQGGRWVLTVYIDKEEGVGLNDCQNISKQLSTIFDVENVIPHRYTLEVSSPGLNRPLVKEKDYIRFRGKKVKIETVNPIEGRKRFVGSLIGCQDGIISLALEKGEQPLTIPLKEVAKARLKVEL